VRDVTAERAAERAAREGEARLRVAITAAGLGTWERDLETGESRWDPRLAAMVGLPPDRAAEGARRWAEFIHPDDREMARRAWARVPPEDGVPSEEIEYRVIPLDVTARGERVFNGRTVRVADGPRGGIRVVGVVRDVTAERAAAAVLAEDRAALERRVEERTRELAEAQERLAHAQRMEALGQLAGGIAHDINNVLQAVGGGAALIERRPEDAATVRRLARMVVNAAERGSAVTRRLLAFSRRGDLRAEAIGAPAASREPPGGPGAHARHGHRGAGGGGLRPSRDAGGQGAAGDRPRQPRHERAGRHGGSGFRHLHRVARTGAGGRSRTGRHAPARRLRPAERDGHGRGHDAGRPGPRVRTVLHDEAAWQGHGTRPRHGTGLREQSGGALHVESTAGRGTTISLWFPLAADSDRLPSRMPGAAEGGSPGSAGAARRVLLVDDEEAVRDITAEALEHAGYEVRRAADAEAALDLLAGGEVVDVLLTDLSMPGMDGLALLRSAKGLRPGLPAVLLTGFATNAAELAAAGPLDHPFVLLRKPVASDVLAAQIATLLGPHGAA
jgi:CheY-like chemotaxis protein